MPDGSIAYPVNDFGGGLDLNQAVSIPNNCFTILNNLFYNNARQLETRRGFKTFGNSIGNSPITSLFFYQRDDNLQRILICFAGTGFYMYNEGTNDWDLVSTPTLHEYETLPGLTSQRTRWDFAVYKNVCYMGNGVDVYCSFDGTSFATIGVDVAVTVDSFDHTTSTITKTAHGLTVDTELFFALSSPGALPTGINYEQTYYVINPTTDTFQISNAKNGSPVTFTDNGSGTATYNVETQPRVRYIQYLGDRMYGAGDDGNPISLYYTDAAPSDANVLTDNIVVIGGDENGIINGVNEYSQLVVVFKDEKVYAVNVVSPSVDAVDSQTGGYSDRSIFSVGDGMVYFNERGVDTLNKRVGVGGSTAIGSTPLSMNVRDLIQKIVPRQYNASAAQYLKSLNNYYFSFDTNDNNIPDTTLVLNSALTARSQYNYPDLYDYGYYIDSDGNYLPLFTSGVNGQVYQMEHGYDDNGTDIVRELQTKNFSFVRGKSSRGWYEDPSQQKIYDFVDIVGYKQVGKDIAVKIYVENQIAAQSFITDDMLQPGVPSRVIGSDPIGIDPIGVSSTDGSGDLPLYLYRCRVPFWARGATISINMSGSCQAVLERMRISVDTEPYEVFEFANIG